MRTRGAVCGRIGLAVVLLATACSGMHADVAVLPQTRPEIAPRDLKAHVARLCSAPLEGRLPGTVGERLAADYLARAFAAAGLEPGRSDGSFEQPFEFAAGVSLGPNNRLEASVAAGAPVSLVLDQQWRPLSLSSRGVISARGVVFAGYGIVAPAVEDGPGRDDYRALDVDGRWVLLLRGVPGGLPTEQRQHLRRHASLRYKAMLARERGAVGILAVAGPDTSVRHDLVPLRFDASARTSALAGISLSRTLAHDLLERAGFDLATLQAAADANDSSARVELPGLKIASHIDLQTEQREGRNVLGRLSAAVPVGTPPLVVGAHYDHLGRGVSGSLARERELGRIHPGADDNASGVAALLEIAEALAAERRRGELPLARDILFAAWSGEELGLLGSTHFLRESSNPHAQGDAGARAYAAYLNMDMVGRLRGDLVVYGIASSPDWQAIVERAAREADIEVAARDDAYLPTDSSVFYTRGIPVLGTFTGSHSQYHTPRDRPRTLDYRGLGRVATFEASLVRQLATRTSLIEAAEVVPPTRMTPRAGIHVYLGTIPDYASGEGDGLPLASVARGGPADEAGLRGGDVVIRVGSQDVTNIYDYTFALEALAPGEAVTIRVRRAGDALEFEVLPGSRD